MKDDLPEGERQQKQLRLVGYGIVVAGLLATLVAYVSSRPHGILLFGLGGLAVATLVFERTQNAAPGLSLGLFTGSFGVWVWPNLGGESYFVLGAMLAAAGVVNAALAPRFQQIGMRLAER